MAANIKGEYPIEVEPLLVESLSLIVDRVKARFTEENDSDLIYVWVDLYNAIRSVQAMECLRQKEKESSADIAVCSEPGCYGETPEVCSRCLKYYCGSHTMFLESENAVFCRRCTTETTAS